MLDLLGHIFFIGMLILEMLGKMVLVSCIINTPQDITNLKSLRLHHLTNPVSL
jgi:hypothetical protein